MLYVNRYLGSPVSLRTFESLQLPLAMSDTSLLTQQIPVHPSKPTLNVQALCSFYGLFSITGMNYLFIAGPIALENELHRAGIFAGFACNVSPVVHL